ncbi:hypothetical protein COCON_G00056340 [Conger conger]|uniref:Ig-like domain-containing protein n=1 Tax=Conger conger TaxID=82655 RepID=A0A9Q1DWG8_CONCO|nr:hypothetical protein COCON_G00056340 [Conger conger]
MGISVLLIVCALLGCRVLSQRVVLVQPGPLVRVEGSHATVWCNVSGYRPGVEQDFEWSVYLQSAPEREMRIVSTSQSNFAYSLYAPRVARGEIYVERVSGDFALLHLAPLEARDQGLYECYTPNTDGAFLGSYSAKTQLTVIPDTLSVTAPGQTLEKAEGDVLQLSCDVTHLTAEHTHLSMGWYLRSGDPEAPPLDLVTLSRDFVLRPGSTHRQRFLSGDLRLDKLSSTSYRLSLVLQPGDQGQLYCEAAQWIQDPDHSWYSMTRKQSNSTTLTVQPTDRDFSIVVSSERKVYQAGETVDLRCSIEAQAVADRFFSVSWVFSSAPLAVVDPGGVPTLSPDYSAREAAGQLTLRKESPALHLLRLRRLTAQDSGKYICRVTERERAGTGEFVDRTKRSRNIQITVLPLKSNISVVLFSNSSEVQEGAPVSLSCLVGGVLSPAGGALSVRWWRGEEEVASVGRDGAVRAGPAYLERSRYGEMSVERGPDHAFTVRLHRALPPDQGQYRCTATEWRQSPHLAWEEIGEKSAVRTLTVRAMESSFSVSASSRTPGVSYGDTFALQCVVKLQSPAPAPVTVTWHFQPPGDGAQFHDLVTLSRDWTLRWGEGLGGGASMRASLDHSASNTVLRLSVSRAGPQQGGTYQCSTHLWRRGYDNTWSHVANRTSNLLGISVTKPVSKLRLLKANQSVGLVEDGRARVNCSVAAQTSADARLAVRWYARKGAEPAELLLTQGAGAGLQYGAYAEEERLRSRLQVERLTPGVYRLTLHRAERSDSGEYYCSVEEWLPDPQGTWYQLALDTSGVTLLSVTPPEPQLQVEETESNVSVSESGSIRLGCSILSQSSRDSRFSMAWYRLRGGGAEPLSEGAEPQCVFSIGHDAVFGNGNCSPAEPSGPDSRLLFQRTTFDLYSLTIQHARPEDSGRYYCHVQEWLLNPRSVWYRLTANDSGLTTVTVRQTDPSLRSVVCSSESLFFFVFFYPFPVFGALLLALGLLRYRGRHAGRGQEGKNGAPLLWIKEPHLNYSPTCLEPPALSLHPGSVD